MRVVVLGGTGFLGTHVCAAFAAAGHHVLPLSTTGAVRVDLADALGAARLTRTLAELRADVVVNAAGRVWRASDQDMERANVELAGRVVDAVRAQPHRVRLVHIGTVHEYGAGVRGASTTESDPAEPVSAYGETKLRGTMAVLDAARTGGLDAVVLRVANVCGPGAPEGSFPHVLVDSVRRALAEGGVTPLRFGSLSAWRDYVDVRDVADAVLAAALAPRDAVAGQIVNIGSGAAVRTRRLVDRMMALSGLRAQVVEAARSHAVRSDVDWLQLDISKARAVLGWQPRRGLDESLRDLLGAGERTRT